MDKFTKANPRFRIVIALFFSVFILTTVCIYINVKTIYLKKSTSDFLISNRNVSKSYDLLMTIQNLYQLSDTASNQKDVESVYKFNYNLMLFKKVLHELDLLTITKSQKELLKNVSYLFKSVENRRSFISYEYSKIRYLINEYVNIENKKHFDLLKSQKFEQLIFITTIGLLVVIIIIVVMIWFIQKVYKHIYFINKLLARSQERLESLIEELPIGILVIDLDRNYYHANKSAVKLTKHKIATNGKIYNNDDLLNEEIKNIIPTLLIDSALNGQKNIGFNSALHIDGHEIPLRISTIPLYNDDKKLENIISVFDDISNIKKAESDLIEANRLINESLQQKEMFLSNMSHEIRTPMNAILGFTELLSKKDLGEVENEYIKTILSAGNTLLRIIDDILDFSKLNANMMIFEEKPYYIHQIIKNVYKLYLPKAIEKGLKLRYSIDQNLIQKVLTDPTRLTQVITNIIGNSLKFTDEGHIYISARLLNETVNDINVEFTISDTGIGIPQDKLENIFKRFEQVTDKRRYGGTGLGLSIVKHIIAQLGGSISVSSVIGQGSRFTFQLIFKKFIPNVGKDYEEISELINNLPIGIPNILLVEDNIHNVQLAKGIFHNFKVNFDAAMDAPEALKKLCENKYDIILMDIELPEIKGYDLFLKLRNELKIETPVVALTAHALATEKAKCKEVGMDDYLTKPIKIDKLIEVISELTGYKIDSKDNSLDLQTKKSEELKFISLEYLHSISGNNKEFEKETIQIFIQQLLLKVDEFNANLYPPKTKELKFILHNLKSLTGMFFKEDLIPQINFIEEAVKSRDFTDEDVYNCLKLIEKINKGVLESQFILEQYE